MRLSRPIFKIMQPQMHLRTNTDVASKNKERRKSFIMLFTDLDMRKSYRKLNDYFDIEHLVSHEPFGQFKKWFEEAVEHVEEPNAFCLATATK